MAATAAAVVALAACGSKSSNGGNTTPATQPAPNTSSQPAGGGSTTPSSTGNALKACMVLDTGGIDDKSFNETSYAGMQAAKKDNPNISISYVPSNSGNDYTPNLNAEVGKKCDPVIAVGGLMEQNVEKAAKANPKTHFAEVDAPSTAPNVYGMQFNTAQGAFLGGYLAAGMTKTGKVATWGGINIPPVTIYMDGFWEGVQYYNKQNNKNVQVLGWNEKNQKGGVFANSFTDQNKGKQISQSLIQQGADIIFPVAGGAGLGAGAAAQASNGQANVIWVDTDGCVSAAQYCKYFITSVTKNLAGAVKTYLDKAASGSWPKGSYIGDLANNGTGLAPYHDFQSKVPASLTSQINKVKQDIISGKIKITSPSQPKS
ncbi:MAG TPA: BMP family ABC transporter substrate-binding protein [Jatrophihabitans sp.]|nr:BMP family ABC transporter substrate-binding protein [Jatrophihabitans sp.]